MEPPAPFELELLRRDWVEGTSEKAFTARVERCCERIDRSREEAVFGSALEGRNKSGSFFFSDGSEAPATLIVSERDPIDFATIFLAGVWSGNPVVLANPDWAATERQQFDQLMIAASPRCGSILIPTGGTNGGVKLAIHDWDSLRAAVEGLHKFLGGGPIHSCCLLPMHHVSGLMQLLRSLLTGGRIRFDDRETKGYCLSLVPTQLQRAFDNAAALEKIETAATVFVGGDRIPTSLALKVRRRRLAITPVYGMTETAAMVAAVPGEAFLEDSEAGAAPIGDTEFRISETGEICIEAPTLFKGYHAKPPIDLSGGYPTGDLGRIDPRGRLHVFGRVDSIIISGGEKIDPREVEAALLGLEGIESAHVVGKADPNWGQEVVAYITGPATSRSDGQLREALRPELAPYKIPKKFLPEV